MTKVYFAGSIRGGRADATLYERLIHYLQQKAHVLTEHVGSSNLNLLEQGKKDQTIYEQDTTWLRECDVLIGECTCPSLGVGYELAYAERFGKPCHIFYDKTKTQLSAMLTGNCYYHIHPYEKEEEIYPILDEILEQRLMIRHATPADLDEVTELEAVCFPPTEAASKEAFSWRLKAYPSHFFVLEKDGRILSFVNGPVTKEKDLVDEMFESADYCDEQGDWLMIFGVATHPDYQHKGYASQVMWRYIQQAREEGKKGVVLTCKEAKIPFYARFGYVDEGLSTSNHGGVPWHQMRLTF